ncbi:uncharacterized protein LOC143283555 [Babylonia areolata]|uniref:uncharacterized protein LOC143283555 n=1 Tax=Babylonia areolata TaxID=304850 RepID=UPI003FCFDC66
MKLVMCGKRGGLHRRELKTTTTTLTFWVDMQKAIVPVGWSGEGLKAGGRRALGPALHCRALDTVDNEFVALHCRALDTVDNEFIAFHSRALDTVDNEFIAFHSRALDTVDNEFIAFHCRALDTVDNEFVALHCRALDTVDNEFVALHCRALDTVDNEFVAFHCRALDTVDNEFTALHCRALDTVDNEFVALHCRALDTVDNEFVAFHCRALDTVDNEFIAFHCRALDTVDNEFIAFHCCALDTRTEAVLHVSLWIWASLCLLSRGKADTSPPPPPPPPPQLLTSNACYSSGGDCGFHSLACGQGRVISVGELHYGFKDQTAYDRHSCQALLADCSAYVSSGSCCGYNVTSDCLRAFSREHRLQVKQDCDGEVTCRVRATDVTGSCSKPPHVYAGVSSYSVITYVCVNASKAVAGATTTSQPDHDCGGRPGCPSSTSSTSGAGGSSGGNDSSQKQNDERMLQLIIGVSVGVGSGFIFLAVVLIVCWIRIRRKPPQDSMSVRSGPSVVTANRPIPRRPSKAHTLTSTMPSSHYSSFFYSDTLPSSHTGSVYNPDTVYNPESIYSVPADDYSPGGSIGPASVVRAHGYSNEEVALAEDSAAQVAARPPEHSSFPPASCESGGSAAVPPQLPQRPSILKPVGPKAVVERDHNMNGIILVPSAQQLSPERQSESGTSSSVPAPNRSSRGVQQAPPYNSQSSRTSRRKGSSLSTTTSSSGREAGAAGHGHRSTASRPHGSHHKASSSSSHREWSHPPLRARDSVQSDPLSDASSSSVFVLPEEGELSHDRLHAVQSWLGSVKPQVPF